MTPVTETGGAAEDESCRGDAWPVETKDVLHEGQWIVRNVTVTLDDETARWARIKAARRDMSVSSLLRELIHEHMGRREAYEGAMVRFLSRPPAKLGGRLPTREEIHDRARLR